VRGVRDQIDFFLADKEGAMTTVAQLFRAAVIDGDPKGVAVVGQRFLARERAFEEVGIFETPRTWRHRLSRREVMTSSSDDAPPALDGLPPLRGVAWGAVTTTETSEPWVTIATPLSGAGDGRLLVIGVLNLKDLWSLIADLRLGQDGRAYVVDRRGGLIAADDANLVLKRLSLISRPFVRSLLEQDRPVGVAGVTGSYTNERGVEAMATGLRVDRVGWGVVVEHPRAVRHLFEKFYRADNVATLETDGTGLGLYLVRLIVEQLGGRVGCESEEGHGATFYFTVPCAQSASPAANIL
jgi:hypothetical protein